MRSRLLACAIAASVLAPVRRLAAQQTDTSAASIPAATRDNAVSVSATLTRARDTVFNAMTRVMAELGFTVAQVDSQAGRITSAASFAWPAGTAAERWHGAVSPGVAVVLRAQAVGTDSTAFSVTAIAPVRPAADSGEVGKTLRMVSAMQVASHVVEALKLQRHQPQ